VNQLLAMPSVAIPSISSWHTRCESTEDRTRRESAVPGSRFRFTVKTPPSHLTQLLGSSVPSVTTVVDVPSPLLLAVEDPVPDSVPVPPRGRSRARPSDVNRLGFWNCPLCSYSTGVHPSGSATAIDRRWGHIAKYHPVYQQANRVVQPCNRLQVVPLTETVHWRCPFFALAIRLAPGISSSTTASCRSTHLRRKHPGCQRSLAFVPYRHAADILHGRNTARNNTVATFLNRLRISGSPHGGTSVD
jgi:hypothetical protein